MNVYDFDETIYNGESSVEFIFFILKKDLSILKFLPQIIKAIILYKREKLSFEDFFRKNGNMLMKYCSTCKLDFPALVSDFWDRNLHKIKAFYYSKRSEDDVIITASPSFMMDDIAERMNWKNLICTEFDISTGEVKRACFRQGKVPMFLERYPDGVIDEFYTDSMNDEFLFPYSKKVFIVKKDEINEFSSPLVGSKLK